MSVLEKLRKLDEERAQLLAGAKAEALEKAERAVVELNSLGFQYELVESSQNRVRREPRAEVAPKRQKHDGPCPICKFTTSPPHDGRAHRSQEPKKPFTAEELEARGYNKE